MEMAFYKPQNEILKKYIEGYYFLNAISNTETISYYTFPNNYCILAISLNSVNIFKDNSILSRPTKDNTLSSSLVYRYIKPIKIILEPPINEVVFYFKPLGINRFIPDFQKIVNKSSSNLSFFEGLEEIMRNVLSANNREMQITEIEKYWLSNLIERDFSLLENILYDLEAGFSIGDVSEKNNLSRQHLLRLFTKYLGKSMSEYRKIERFRNAIRSEVPKTSLTKKAYENKYFDQSHFINDFKGLTSIKPSKFFKEVDINKPTIWYFI